MRSITGCQSGVTSYRPAQPPCAAPSSRIGNRVSAPAEYSSISANVGVVAWLSGSTSSDVSASEPTIIPVFRSGLKYHPVSKSAQTGVGLRHDVGLRTSTTGCRLALMGIAAPAIAAMWPPHTPATLMTAGDEISPAEVVTPAIFLPSIRRPVTVVFRITST